MNIEEILDALPAGDLIVTLRNASAQKIVSSTPIERPTEADEPDESGLPTLKFVFDDGSGMGGTWPVESISQSEDGSVQLYGPRGIAYLRSA